MIYSIRSFCAVTLQFICLRILGKDFVDKRGYDMGINISRRRKPSNFGWVEVKPSDNSNVELKSFTFPRNYEEIYSIGWYVLNFLLFFRYIQNNVITVNLTMT